MNTEKLHIIAEVLGKDVSKVTQEDIKAYATFKTDIENELQIQQEHASSEGSFKEQD